MSKQANPSATKDWLNIAFNSIGHDINKDAFKRKKGDWACAIGCIMAFKMDQLTSPRSTNIKKVNHLLQGVLQPAAIPDPFIINKNDLSCQILGQDFTFKVDTGAKVSTLDSRDIVWNRGSDEQLANEAWQINKDMFAERSTLFLPHLNDLPATYNTISFGTVESFKMITNKEGTEGIDIIKPHPVVGISWPMRSNGEKDEQPRPVIRVDVGEHPILKTVDVALVARPKLSRRGLYGEKDIIKNGQSIVLDENKDTTIIDFKKVDPVKMFKAVAHLYN